MNSLELAARISEHHKITKTQAKEIIDTVCKAISETAAGGDEVSLTGFGKFKVQSRPARTGRNPRTGEAIKISASKRLAFAPAKAVREALNAAPKKRKKAAK